ncbi:MAG: AMP nucleosidase [Alphaproteobacteria bacterium]
MARRNYGRIPARDLLPFTTADEAVARIGEIYRSSVRTIRDRFARFANGEDSGGPVHASYPYVAITVDADPKNLDTRRAYGFARGRGNFGVTVTRPDLFEAYYREQIGTLLLHHGPPVHVGVSEQRIPLHFALDESLGDHLSGLTPERLVSVADTFDLPDLVHMTDDISNGTYVPPDGDPWPLALFEAPRVDLSLQRLRHYTGTRPEHFQRFVLFTNYQFYIDEFIRYGQAEMAHPPAGGDDGYTEFVEPGEVVTTRGGSIAGPKPTRMPQMPAYHLKRPSGDGITMVNIGVGPSNAKNITDHIAVLRPHCWIMLGHCGGLRSSQRLGDYVLAHGYLRDDKILDYDLPIWVPVPPIAEVQVALQDAVMETTGVTGYGVKQVMRTGTVATVDNRNWELQGANAALKRFELARAIAVDMESATIAANGLRFRVPYGTLLCISDRPVHGELKLPGMADSFYRNRVNQHLQIGLRAIDVLRERGPEELHSRKLRTLDEPAFR